MLMMRQRRSLARQAEADIGYSGHRLAAHQVADAYVHRVALTQGDVRQGDVILVLADATAYDVALVVINTA